MHRNIFLRIETITPTYNIFNPKHTKEDLNKYISFKFFEEYLKEIQI